MGKDDAQMSLSESSVESSIMSGKVCVKEEEKRKRRGREEEERRKREEKRGEEREEEREERGERICWCVCSWLACD